ncbi:MAG: RIP metalloprotease RseP [Bacteroidales bacterium]|nr:RIP metalloprotease RseP [Bacteroidales bacterium]
MTTLIMIAQLILGLSILVILHELGHFTAARLFGMRVPKFYLFFNPYFSIFKCKKINGKWKCAFFAKNQSSYEYVTDDNGNICYDEKGKKMTKPIDLEKLPENDWRKHEEHTEYGIGWLPVGGFCQISGMIDESMDKEAMKKPPQSWEFRSKPAWQRLIVMIGGVLMNLILGIVLFIYITYNVEGAYIANQEVSKDGVYVYPVGENVGFKTGDKILEINGKDVVRFKDAQKSSLYFGSTVTVERDGQTLDIHIPDSAYKILMSGGGTPFFDNSNFKKIIVDSVLPNLPAFKSGIRKGDQIVAFNDTLLESYGMFRHYVRQHTNSEIVATVVREQDTLNFTLQMDSLPYVGIIVPTPYNPEHYTIGQAFVYGFTDAYDMLKTNIKGLGNVISGKDKATDSLSGPIGIATIYGGVWNWDRFWFITAILSLVLAFMNILPIPALDGGHVLFLFVEIITRRKPSDKFLEYAQTVGMILLMLLMIFVIGNDIFKLFK